MITISLRVVLSNFRSKVFSWNLSFRGLNFQGLKILDTWKVTSNSGNRSAKLQNDKNCSYHSYNNRYNNSENYKHRPLYFPFKLPTKSCLGQGNFNLTNSPLTFSRWRATVGTTQPKKSHRGVQPCLTLYMTASLVEQGTWRDGCARGIACEKQ